eukprot:14788793-Alexandrium_andersonii.AAC.1
MEYFGPFSVLAKELFRASVIVTFGRWLDEAIGLLCCRRWVAEGLPGPPRDLPRAAPGAHHCPPVTGSAEMICHWCAIWG